MNEEIHEIPSEESLTARAKRALLACGANERLARGEGRTSSPINGRPLTRQGLAQSDADDIDDVVCRSHEAFLEWRLTPAPVRGALIVRLRRLLSIHKSDLAELISIEVGKIVSEAHGEVQEMIDICDFAVGLSRQLYGNTMPSERPNHRLMENWHPLGPVAVISAFNFPTAVWAWNAALALVCGNSVLWKPSDLTPLTSLAVTSLVDQAIEVAGAPRNLHQLLLGGAELGVALVDHSGVPLVSATGSTRMGREVGPRVARRFGRSLLELGGNNAAIVARSANLDLTVRGVVFSAVGTAGQRCTTLRRLIVHEDAIDEVTDRLARAYETLRIGNPLAQRTLVGPLIDAQAFAAVGATLQDLRNERAEVVAGGVRELEAEGPEAFYLAPALVRVQQHSETMRRETFGPLLTVIGYQDLDEALALNNNVPQGLSSSIFTSDLSDAERFLSAAGSDCGIANVNIGTSGAEIGGAFGGEKETGGGREAGSDSWKVYMRRATNTVNYGGELPLAQGVSFL